MPDSQAVTPTQDILWKQYELHVGLYKEYLNLLLKFNAFYYAATGAILSYYFSKPEIPWMRFSLLFPCVMSVALSLLFFYGASQSEYTRQELFQIRDRLGLDTAPEYAVLKVFLWISAVLMVVVAISLLGIVIYVRLPVPIRVTTTEGFVFP
ncbi:MAG TPA: hypothetical protein VK686_19205 [Bryobacteraceae bacterium]|jgi:hypothetical protein|nr:hypothetical protein [Bryobacteraceae bacterium]